VEESVEETTNSAILQNVLVDQWPWKFTKGGTELPQRREGMNPEQINRLIVTEVMGWPDKYHTAVAVAGFDPYHNREHAFMALEKFITDHDLDVDIFKAWNTGWGCQVTNRPFGGPKELEIHGYAAAATPSAAICEAIASALGGKE